MKKNILKFLSVLFCVALFMTGCATVSDIYGKDGKAIYYNDIQYYQGQVVKAGDYLYYGNGYTAVDAEGFDYGTAASTGYLARLNVEQSFKYKDDVKEEDKDKTSPLGIEKVNDKLTGYQKQDMFALGGFIYFTSANTHKTDKLENDYTQVSLFRVRFNGDDFEEIGTFRSDEKSIITTQKGSDGNYYYIVYAPTSNKEVYNLSSIKIGDSIGDTKTLAEDVKTLAICDSDSTEKNIVYSTITKSAEGKETTTIKTVDFATGATEDKYLGGSADAKIEFIDRVGDIVFYSHEDKGIKEVYYKNLVESDNGFDGAKSHKFYNAPSIKNIEKAGNGYIFVSTSSSSLMYKNLEISEDAKLLLTTEEYKDVLFVDGDYIYYSNETTIARVNVVDSTKENIVTMKKIVSGQCGYVDGYIYFFAQLETGEEDTENTDFYMYRTDKQGRYQLVGQTK